MKIASINKDFTTVKQVCFVTEPPFDDGRAKHFERLSKEHGVLKQFDWEVKDGMVLVRAGGGYGEPVFMSAPVKVALSQCFDAVEKSLEAENQRIAIDKAANLKQAEDVAKLFDVPLA